MTRIKNTSRASQGVHCVDGLKFIEPGQTRTLDVHPDYIERLKALPFMTLNGDEDEARELPETMTLSRHEMEEMRRRFDGMTGEINRLKADLSSAQAAKDDLAKQLEAANTEIEKLRTKAADAPVKLEAKHRGGGSYSVMDADGKEVLEKLSKADAEAFNAMSAEEQAEYVAKG